MIHHLVIWKLKDFADNRTKAENAQLLKQKLEALPNTILEIVELRVGINIENQYTNADVVLHTYFNSMQDLETYQNHPEHQKVGQFISEIRQERHCIEYEF